MKVKELIGLLNRFEPEAEVRVGVNWPDRVTEMHENIWVGDYGDGPQINAAMDLRGLRIHVGCVLQQAVRNRPPKTIELGNYESAEIAAKVRDFYVVHKHMDEPLNFPDFDYEKWIPPRTTSGAYNEHVAKILEEKLLHD